MNFMGVQGQDAIYAKWQKLVNVGKDIKDESLKLSTAIVLENAQRLVDHNAKTANGRSLLCEAASPAGVGTLNAFGPATPGDSYANTTGDARVPSIVIPMIRRIYPQLIAHKLVGVQPMQAPIGMAFAFRAKYGRFGRGDVAEGTEIGYLFNDPAHTGKPQYEGKFTNNGGIGNHSYVDQDGNVVDAASGRAQDQGALDMNPFTTPTGGIRTQFDNVAKAVSNDPQTDSAFSYFFGQRQVPYVGDGADTSDAENWAVGRDMPEAGFEILKATVTAKTRKLGVQITRETEEDMKAMQGLNAQQEISDLLSYEIAQEMDRQLLGEIVQSAVRAGNAMVWDPAKADGRNQNERVNTLYTTILNKSAQIAVKSRRGAANWCVASPGAAALLEAHIYNPLSVAGGMGNASAFGKSIDQGIGVTDIGTLRNGTIKLYRDTLAGGEYILLGFKGNNIYDAGIIYLPYIPLELMQAQDPFTFNPITAARTRYGVTTNLFGAGQFYQFIGLKGVNAEDGDLSKADTQKVFMQ
jgi:hypothetical protein